MDIGVLALQGDVSEHIGAVERALAAMGKRGRAVPVRRVSDLRGVAALALPGGESTTISRLLVQKGLFGEVQRLAGEGVPVLGTCAGCVLLAKEGDVQAERCRLLGLMDMEVARNAFGRQRESFEANLPVALDRERVMRAVFIRAPVIRRVWGGCRGLGQVDEGIVAARQGNLLAAAFHPELGGETAFYEYFLSMA